MNEEYDRGNDDRASCESRKGERPDGALGFTLEEIRSLLRLRSGGRASCDSVQRKAAAHARDIRERIARLRAMERTLTQLVRTCQRRGRSDECPILRSLEAGR